MKEAYLYEKLEGDRVRCNLCRHHCIIAESRRGICKVRENQKGILYSLVYGKAIAAHIDPIEKKPLYHFHPGSNSFSLATVGCNFKCSYCQNYSISQTNGLISGTELPPEAIVEKALQADCLSISYTYTEPTVFFEYAYETAMLSKKAEMKNNFITNGYISDEALEMIHPYLDAVNVDIKSMNEDFYKKYVKALLSGVLESVRKIKELGIWLEVTTLIIPTVNDSVDELERSAQFIAELGVDTPWHVSGFHPDYKLTNIEPTPLKTLELAREIGLKAGLRYVYTGNIPGGDGENTYCYECGGLLIERAGFYTVRNHIKGDKCPFCNTKIDGVWM